MSTRRVDHDGELLDKVSQLAKRLGLELRSYDEGFDLWDKYAGQFKGPFVLGPEADPYSLANGAKPNLFPLADIEHYLRVRLRADQRGFKLIGDFESGFWLMSTFDKE